MNESRLSTGESGERASLGADMDNFNLDVGAVLGGEESDGCGGASAGTVLIQHTMQQAAMSDELQTIEESLGLKEKLLEQLQVPVLTPLSSNRPPPKP